MKEVKLLELRGRSVFSPYLNDFVSQKRAMGCRFDAAVEALNQFDDFCIKQGVNEVKITPELFQKWCKHRPNESQRTQGIRISYVQNFCKFLYNNGIEAPYLFHPLPRQSKDFVPYIYTEDEIARFLNAVDKAHEKPIIGAPVRHLVYPVLFRILCGCGLRINEALMLKTEDVDLDKGTFLIRNAKGGKDRMIVLSDSLLEVCRKYRTEPLIKEYGHDYFLPNREHGFYDSSTVYADFRKYLRSAGISHRGRGKGPRLHDFRHTFAVRVLSKWQSEGKDIYICLPILQTYLGHTRLSSTEQYLKLTPESYAMITQACEDTFGYIFPEVDYEKQ